MEMVLKFITSEINLRYRELYFLTVAMLLRLHVVWCWDCSLYRTISNDNNISL